MGPNKFMVHMEYTTLHYKLLECIGAQRSNVPRPVLVVLLHGSQSLLGSEMRRNSTAL